MHNALSKESPQERAPWQGMLKGEPRPGIDYPAWCDFPTTPIQLVLEGGAMRNLFTCGVLDFLLDQGIIAESVVGVSAGALCGYNYASGASGRMAFLDIAYRKNWRMMSLRSKIATGSYVGRKFLFDYLPNTAERFDYRWFSESPVDLVSVASDLLTGKPDYHHFEKTLDVRRSMKYLAGSSALPLANVPVYVDGKLLVDGGVCDCVPFAWGHEKYQGRQLVVLTRPRGFRQHSENRMALLAYTRYAAFPRFVPEMAAKTRRYNRQYAHIEQLHDSGELFAIWPREPLDVRMAESDEEKLLGAYETGLRRMAELWPDIQRYFKLEKRQ